MRENNKSPDPEVFQRYIKLEKKYAREAFENLAAAVGGDRGEIKRFFDLGKFYKNITFYDFNNFTSSCLLLSNIFHKIQKVRDNLRSDAVKWAVANELLNSALEGGRQTQLETLLENPHVGKTSIS